MNQGPFDNDNQFVVSYELLLLFRWLLENEEESLKKLINKALHNGFYNEIDTIPLSYEEESQNELQHTLVDFFSLLETLLYELMSENEVKRVMQRSLIPAIDQIDATACDNNAMAISIAKATSAYEANPHADPKDILCKELLKRWKPAKEIVTN